jgi:hypothetical protein
LKVDFSPEGSFDSARWDFDDGAMSREYAPSHTFTDSGIHKVRLTGIGSHGCKDSSFREIFVQDPIIDVRIPEIHVSETDDYYEVRAPIENLGPIRLEYLELELKAYDAPAIKEVWTGKLEPGRREVYDLQARIEKGNGIPTLCVTAVNPNHLTDHAPGNNEACWTPKGGLDILNLYPNPSSGELNVELRIPSQQDIRYRIIDARGRKVMDRRIEDAPKGFMRIRPPIGQLGNATYSIRIEGKNASVQRSFIKRKE